MSFFNELMRRNVFRVAIAYAVVAWLILQVVDVVLNNIEAPGWVFQATLLLLGVGFIVVIVFSWVFEITPEGIKRESEIIRDHSIAPQTGKKLDRLITGVLVLALGYFVIDKFVLSAGREAALVEAALQEAQVQPEAPAAAEAPEDDNSIAVLPFVNMSEESANEYFSDGISEEILNALASVRELKVAGRTSSFAFKGQNQDLRVIGETLGVQNILEGSVRKSGDRVRITAQLVKVDDGFHLWSETFDRELDDVFAIQDEIANAILGAMKTTLLGETVPQIATARANTEAYDLFLLAKQGIYQRTKESLDSAAQFLDRAISIDPNYAPAWAQRGITALLLSESPYGDTPNEIAKAEGKEFLDRALELDKNLAEGWAGLGLYYNGPPLVPDKAIEALEKARKLNPSLVNAGNWLVLAYWGVNRLKDSLALLDEITAIDPFYKPAMGNQVFALTRMGRNQEARAYVDRIEPFMDDKSQVRQTRAWIDSAEGQSAAGLKRMQAALENAPTDRVYRVGVNVGFFDTHQFDKVTDDHFSPIIITALVIQQKTEEAGIIARERASKGRVPQYFRYLVLTGNHAELVNYLEENWVDLGEFQADIPPGLFGYWPMLYIADAYRVTGNTEGFTEAMQRVADATQSAVGQGAVSRSISHIAAAHAALAGDSRQAIVHLGRAVDLGFVSSARISQLAPWFKEIEDDPAYQEVQARMIDNVNKQRALLGLTPIEA